MLKRVITGACFVLVTVGFFLLRIIDVRLFNIYIWFLSVVGTFEMCRAVKNYTLRFKNTYKTESGYDYFVLAVNMLFALAFIPLYTFFGYIGSGVALAVCVATLTVAYPFAQDKAIKKYLVAISPLFYPNLFLLAMAVANGISGLGLIALVLIFVIGPFADTFAYFVGSLIGGKKLCPKISPKKTISGAIGGLVGGTLGSVIIYFIFTPTVNFFSPILLFVIVGLFGSLFTELGDLFESAIKRKVGIKDSGKILPGHGGVLDRIDGIMFVSLFIAIIFSIL